MKGISIDNWMVFFGNKETIDREIQYDIKNINNGTLNLLLNMKPEKPYMLNIIKGGSKFSKERVVASKEGTLFFTAPGSCRVEITPL
jgi:hypothetical protein